MEFKDGLPTYINLTRTLDDGTIDTYPEFLLCTSCTVSFVFVEQFSETAKTTLDMSFNGGTTTIPVNFVNVNLTAPAFVDDDGEVAENVPTDYSWNMDIAFIEKQYNTEDNFTNAAENTLGLAPMDTEDADLLLRQFLYQFGLAQVDMGLLESYAFNCFDGFAIGGTAGEYAEMGCSDAEEEDGIAGYDNQSAV